MTKTHSAAFTFNNRTDEVYPASKQILSFIATTLSPRLFPEDLESRCKMLVTELLGNSLKHSETESTLVEVEICHDSLKISKSDSGKIFQIKEHNGRDIDWPIPKDLLNTKIEIGRDDLSSLNCIPIDSYQLKFQVKFLPFDRLGDSPDLMEHFGLLILTKASDEFTYIYREENSRNTFTATIKI